MKKGSLALLGNYVKVSFRNLINQKFFSIINITGLSIGLVSVILMTVFVDFEMSYDKYHQNHEDIYRVAINGVGRYTPSRLGVAMKDEFAEVESYARFNGPYEETLLVDNIPVKQKGIFIADSTLFDVFSFTLLEGAKSTVLKNPNSVVISEKMAEKYFPGESPMNQSMIIDSEEFIVTGVIENSPINTHAPFEIIKSMPTDSWVTGGSWTGNNFYTYVKLYEGSDPEDVHAKMLDLVRKYIGPELIQYSGHTSFDEFLAEGNSHTFKLIPIADIHLHHPQLNVVRAGNITNLYIFGAVAVFILILACINFMNLSTSRASKRSKEVGLRKVMGSAKGSISLQFITESMVIAFFSLLIALLLAGALLPVFNQMTGVELSFINLLKPQLWVLYISIAFITGLLAGSYPAFYMSAFTPVVAMKGSGSDKQGSPVLRSILVVFQFAVSLAIMAATVIVYKQINYLQDQNLGLESDQVVVLRQFAAVDNPTSFVNSLSSNPQIVDYSISTAYPSSRLPNWGYKTVDRNELTYSPMHMFTDHKFLTTYGIELKEGRFFDKGRASDTASVVINEAFASKLPYEDVIGQVLSRGRGQNFEIIGIVKDFHYGSMHKNVGPLIFRFLSEGNQDIMSSRYLTLKMGDARKTLPMVESTWNQMVNDETFDYVFLDESYASLYESEQKFGFTFMVFSVVAILIACLGLLGLASYTLKVRLKEIMIRKVLGAELKDLVSILIKDFTIWIIAGTILGVPIAYYTMKNWLLNFVIQTDMGIVSFLLPVLTLMILCWSIIMTLIAKVSKTNPTEVLADA